MTIDEAKEWLVRIREIAHDDEMAHSGEDDFRGEVLEAIAEGSPDAIELAKLALESSKIEFARWCA